MYSIMHYIPYVIFQTSFMFSFFHVLVPFYHLHFRIPKEYLRAKIGVLLLCADTWVVVVFLEGTEFSCLFACLFASIQPKTR